MPTRSRGRKRRAYWLPTIGVSAKTDDLEAIVPGVTGTFAVAPDGAIETLISPLTFDQPRDERNAQLATSSLADIVGSGYILKRIVGKFFCALEQRPFDAQATAPRAALVTAGFFVARADEGSPSFPVGATTGDLTSYSPGNNENIREPWIWRRTWILSNFADPSPVNNSTSNYPPSNAFGGSGGTFDGPHIDAKTGRRVNSDDRLWFAVSTTKYPIDNVTVFDVALQGDFFLDYRLLGHLVRQMSRGTF